MFDLQIKFERIRGFVPLLFVSSIQKDTVPKPSWQAAGWHSVLRMGKSAQLDLDLYAPIDNWAHLKFYLGLVEILKLLISLIPIKSFMALTDLFKLDLYH